MSTAQGERRLRLAASRHLLYSLPMNELFELPGRPHVVYQLRSYANTGNSEEAAQAARNDSPFLFKAFETGQIGPKRLARMHGDKPRVATIHEYLDWTVTAQAAEGDDELDFGGFRVLVILPRYRSGWPPPEDQPVPPEETTRKPHIMGAPLSPVPVLQTHGKPVTAATIRSGPGYLEIPFVATHENKRGRGYCRCLVEAIEQVARKLGLPKLMLCSTNDHAVKSTWQHLGFEFASDEQMEHWDILHTDLVYLQNTTQMHKDVPQPRRFKPVLIKHENFKQRCYALVGHKRQYNPLLANGMIPAAKQPRLSKRSESRRSESTSRSESLSVMAQEPSASAWTPRQACGGGGSSRSQAAAGAPASAMAVHNSASAGPELRQGGPAPDDVVAGGGPRTPPPADGGPARPLHTYATAAGSTLSQSDMCAPEMASVRGVGPGSRGAFGGGRLDLGTGALHTPAPPMEPQTRPEIDYSDSAALAAAVLGYMPGTELAPQPACSSAVGQGMFGGPLGALGAPFQLGPGPPGLQQPLAAGVSLQGMPTCQGLQAGMVGQHDGSQDIGLFMGATGSVGMQLLQPGGALPGPSAPVHLPDAAG